MTKMNIDYLCYDPATYPVHDIAELITHAHVWSAYQHGLLKDFRKAVKSPSAYGAMSEAIMHFENIANKLNDHPLFSSYYAVVNDQPVGVVVTGHDVLDDSLQTGEIKTLAVHYNYWGQGIGARLLKSGELFLKEKGCQRIILDVEDINQMAISIYEGSGWKKTENVRHHAPTGGRVGTFLEFEKRF